MLRQGVKFHNGNAFNADDVVASIARLLDPTARARGNLANVMRAEKVDDFTVDFVLNGPYPLLLNDLSGIFIMDKEWLEANNATKPGNIATGVDDLRLDERQRHRPVQARELPARQPHRCWSSTRTGGTSPSTI